MANMISGIISITVGAVILAKVHQQVVSAVVLEGRLELELVPSLVHKRLIVLIHHCPAFCIK